MNDLDAAPRWPELIIWMCFGESEEAPFTGVLELGEAALVDDEGDDDDGPPAPRTVHVSKQGKRFRIETQEGDPLVIRGLTHAWVFSPGSDVPGRVELDDYTGGPHAGFVMRPEPTQWRGDDFTIPTGPPRRVEHLGRAAWEVELAPPPHNPSPLVLTIDAATGMLLRKRSVQLGDLFTWTGIESDAELTEELFEWDGDFHFAYGSSDIPDDLREMHEQEEVRRRHLLEQTGIGPLVVEVSADPELWGDTADSIGVFFDLQAHVSVSRRARGTEGDDDDHGDDPALEWSDDRWQWSLRASENIAAEQLELIRRQITATGSKG